MIYGKVQQRGTETEEFFKSGMQIYLRRVLKIKSTTTDLKTFWMVEVALLIG
jgi:hypothetical protein